ncbi:MAG: helix-turn-helix transcriptional regulator [Legionellaceae bacterium]|nr:helix-turn-helix transcriptional regulator [Legionellaceae bacterium]
MNKKVRKVYSAYCQDAAMLLGQLIQAGRKDKKITVTELAERAGISRGTLYKIEQGGLTCELGSVFEVAALVGVKLFNMTEKTLSSEVEHMREKLALLPERIRKKQEHFDDNF